jgi:hypothetical protein
MMDLNMFSKSKTTQNLINGTIDTLGKKKRGCA